MYSGGDSYRPPSEMPRDRRRDSNRRDSGDDHRDRRDDRETRDARHNAKAPTPLRKADSAPYHMGQASPFRSPALSPREAPKRPVSKPPTVNTGVDQSPAIVNSPSDNFLTALLASLSEHLFLDSKIEKEKQIIDQVKRQQNRLGLGSGSIDSASEHRIWADRSSRAHHEYKASQDKRKKSLMMTAKHLYQFLDARDKNVSAASPTFTEQQEKRLLHMLQESVRGHCQPILAAQERKLREGDQGLSKKCDEACMEAQKVKKQCDQILASTNAWSTKYDKVLEGMPMQVKEDVKSEIRQEVMQVCKAEFDQELGHFKQQVEAQNNKQIAAFIEQRELQHSRDLEELKQKIEKQCEDTLRDVMESFTKEVTSFKATLKEQNEASQKDLREDIQKMKDEVRATTFGKVTFDQLRNAQKTTGQAVDALEDRLDTLQASAQSNPSTEELKEIRDNVSITDTDLAALRARIEVLEQRKAQQQRAGGAQELARSTIHSTEPITDQTQAIEEITRTLSGLNKDNTSLIRFRGDMLEDVRKLENNVRDLEKNVQRLEGGGGLDHQQIKSDSSHRALSSGHDHSDSGLVAKTSKKELKEILNKLEIKTQKWVMTVLDPEQQDRDIDTLRTTVGDLGSQVAALQAQPDLTNASDHTGAIEDIKKTITSLQGQLDTHKGDLSRTLADHEMRISSNYNQQANLKSPEMSRLIIQEVAKNTPRTLTTQLEACVGQIMHLQQRVLAVEGEFTNKRRRMPNGSSVPVANAQPGAPSPQLLGQQRPNHHQSPRSHARVANQS